MRLLARPPFRVALATVLAVLGYEFVTWFTHGRHAQIVELCMCAGFMMTYAGLVVWLTRIGTSLQSLLMINGFQSASKAAEMDEPTLGRLVSRFIIGGCMMATFGAVMDAWDDWRKREKAANSPSADQPANLSE